MKKSIYESLRTRKYKIPNRIIAFLYYVIMVKIIGKKYNMHINKIDDVRDCDGPCIVLFNHLSRIDHVYLLAATYPRRFNMIAEFNEFYRQKFSTIFALNNCIPKKNYTPDLLMTKGMARVLKQGGCVAIAPEGLASNFGTNKPVVPGTAKLFKHYNVPVYFCHLEGTYLQNTKACLDERYGETYATISLMFSKEDIQNKSVEEMDEIMNNAFHQNEYLWNHEKNIKWDTRGRICYHLEDILYRCPKCGSEFSLETGNDFIRCKACGNGATMDDYYKFHPYKDSIIPITPTHWVDEQRAVLVDDIRKDKNYSFLEPVSIGNLDDTKLITDKAASCFIVGHGDFTVDHNGVHYKGTRNGEECEFHLSYKEIYTVVTVTDATRFSFYVKGEYFEIIPDDHSKTGKFLLLIEEMHRLHINFYKNFKWYDYMYEGKELGIDIE